jgi:hypothetical protein
MRHALIALLCASVAFAAPKKAPAPKKEEPAKEESDEGGGDEGGEGDEGEGGPPEGSMKAAQPGANKDGSTQHTVEKGDTLWDLSQRYLGSPWYWPKVWSYNPEIANPHWIYPGNVVRFFSTGEEVPTQVELGEPEDVSQGSLIDEDKVVVTGKIAFEPKGTLLFRAHGFVTPKDLEEAGHISGSFEEVQLLSSYVNVYLQFKNKGGAKIGDRFVIFRPGIEVDNPNTGSTVGYLTEVRGVLKILRTDGPMVTAMITESFDTIERGDLVAPYSEALSKRVAAKPNDKKLDATVVAYLGQGTYATIIIDQGSNQGVQPGNTFTVLRQQDGLVHDVANHPEYRDEHYPIEDVGTCIAWEVKTTATSCVLVRALREIVVGDWVQMQPGGAASGSSPRASR